MKFHLAGTRSHPLKTSLSRWLLSSMAALTMGATSTRTVFAEERVAQKAASRPAKAIPEEKDTRVERKPAEAISSGLDYLLKQQQPDGGWGQGGGWRQGQNGRSGRVEGTNVE